MSKNDFWDFEFLVVVVLKRVVVVLGLFFRKKRVVVVFRGSGCSGFSPGFGRQAESGKFSGFGVVVLN